MCAQFQERYPHITWVGCNAHIMDLALADIGKMAWAEQAISEAKEVRDMTLTGRRRTVLILEFINSVITGI